MKQNINNKILLEELCSDEKYIVKANRILYKRGEVYKQQTTDGIYSQRDMYMNQLVLKELFMYRLKDEEQKQMYVSNLVYRVNNK